MKKTPHGLIADIGATNARFALSDGSGYQDECVLKCADYPGLADAARAYLDRVGVSGQVRIGAIAVAAPVVGDAVEMTNHPWRFSIESTRREMGLERLVVMNDFRAIALGVPHLTPEQTRIIGPQIPARAREPIGIIGPGTGLGVASLVWSGTGYMPVPGEGGHVTIAAKTQREFDVFEVLYEKYTHISAERVCSGKGLVNLYNALRALDGRDDLPDRTPEEVSAAALTRSCPICVEALDMLIGFLGTVSGNLALTLGAFGGIYLAGGICLQLGEAFFNSGFRAAFEAKGRFTDYIKDIPTVLILHPYVALIGLSAEVAEK